MVKVNGKFVFTAKGNVGLGAKRRHKTTDAEDVLYLWDGENVLAELTGFGELIAHYTDYPGYWGRLTSLFLGAGAPGVESALFNTATFGSSMFNQAGSSPAGLGSFFYLFDQNSNTRYLLDAAQVTTDTAVYRAFGEEVVKTGSTRNPYRLSGESRTIY